tara:strand:- start:582 stop:1565 length:984 start_codon:yes stop_codon:yes gene_type:complete
MKSALLEQASENKSLRESNENSISISKFIKEEATYEQLLNLTFNSDYKTKYIETNVLEKHAISLINNIIKEPKKLNVQEKFNILENVVLNEGVDLDINWIENAIARNYGKWSRLVSKDTFTRDLNYDLAKKYGHKNPHLISFNPHDKNVSSFDLAKYKENREIIKNLSSQMKKLSKERDKLKEIKRKITEEIKQKIKDVKKDLNRSNVRDLANQKLNSDQKIDNLKWQGKQLKSQNEAMMLVLGGIAITAAIYFLYKRFFSLKAQTCKNSKDRVECLKNIKKKGYKYAIDILQKARKNCNKKVDKEKKLKCESKFDKQISKWKKKAA